MSSQPPTLLGLARSTPEFVNSVRLPTLPTAQSLETLQSFEAFSKLDPFGAYLKYTIEIPGVRKVQCSLLIALELIQRSMMNREDLKPNLGYFPDVDRLAANFA